MNLKAKIVDRKEIAQGVIEVDWQILPASPAGGDKKTLQFLPGQYLSITLPELFFPDPRGAIRYFSIITPPSLNTSFGIATRLSPSGYKRSLMRMSFARIVELGSVSGQLLLPADDQRRVVMIAGGIGITPFMSMLRYLQEKKSTQPITLLYTNRNEESTPFLPELKNYVRKIDNFQLHLIMIEQPDWQGDSLPLNHETIKTQVPDYKQAYYLVSGPNSFVMAVTNNFDRLGIKPDQYSLEEFVGYKNV